MGEKQRRGPAEPEMLGIMIHRATGTQQVLDLSRAAFEPMVTHLNNQLGAVGMGPQQTWAVFTAALALDIYAACSYRDALYQQAVDEAITVLRTEIDLLHQRACKKNQIIPRFVKDLVPIIPTPKENKR